MTIISSEIMKLWLQALCAFVRRTSIFTTYMIMVSYFNISLFICFIAYMELFSFYKISFIITRFLLKEFLQFFYNSGIIQVLINKLINSYQDIIAEIYKICCWFYPLILYLWHATKDSIYYFYFQLQLNPFFKFSILSR